MKKLYFIFICSILSLNIQAQDIHFSQFFFSPQYLSPAEIGNIDSKYRLNANQKTQWREVSQPYNTFALMGDGRFDFVPEEIGLGLLISNDRAGDSRFNTFNFLLGGSYRYNLEKSGRHSLQGGLQIGLTQIRIDQSALSFNNQYNGVVYDPNLPTGENLARNARWFFNLNAGALYNFKPEDRKIITLGIAAHNLSAPKQSFFNDTGIQLPLRFSAYATAEWKIAEEFDLMPSLRFMDQGTYSEFIFGSALRYILMDERSLYRTVFAGYYGRFGDSGIAMLGFELDEWRFAASYDINVSDLETASRNQGGFEFSLQYLFGRKQSANKFRHKFCPVYL
jgi:type IX secretion system PorP/SprF family membrane protein